MQGNRERPPPVPSATHRVDLSIQLFGWAGLSISVILAFYSRPSAVPGIPNYVFFNEPWLQFIILVTFLSGVVVGFSLSRITGVKVWSVILGCIALAVGTAILAFGYVSAIPITSPEGATTYVEIYPQFSIFFAFGVGVLLLQLFHPESPAPVSPGSRLSSKRPICPRCGEPKTFIAEYGRWYCYRDQAYL